MTRSFDIDVSSSKGPSENKKGSKATLSKETARANVIAWLWSWRNANPENTASNGAADEEEDHKKKKKRSAKKKQGGE